MFGRPDRRLLSDRVERANEAASELAARAAAWLGMADRLSNRNYQILALSSQAVQGLPPMIRRRERWPSGVPEATSNPHAGIQFASQSVSSTNVTTKIATPKIMSCPRTKFGRSAALILIIAPPEQIEM